MKIIHSNATQSSSTIKDAYLSTASKHVNISACQNIYCTPLECLRKAYH